MITFRVPINLFIIFSKKFIDQLKLSNICFANGMQGNTFKIFESLYYMTFVIKKIIQIPFEENEKKMTYAVGKSWYF